MKKSLKLVGLLALAAIAIAAFVGPKEIVASTTGYLYGHGLYIQSKPGTTVASISNAGAMVVTSIANSGALSATSLTGTSAVVTGTTGIQVSTASTSGTSLRLMGAVVTLSTRPATIGEVWFQTSDYKLFVSTYAPAHNYAACPAAVCYKELTN